MMPSLVSSLLCSCRWVRFETSRLGPPRDSVQAPVAHPLHGMDVDGRDRRRAYYYQQRRTHVTIRSTMDGAVGKASS